jgi:hypothetical protein
VTPDFGGELAICTVAAAPIVPPASNPSASACDPHREAIELGLSKGRNAKAIWQDLVDIHGFASGYHIVKRFIRSLRGKSSPESRAVIETAPGEECQVDYGSGPLVRDADQGRGPPQTHTAGIQNLLLRASRVGQQMGAVCRKMYEERDKSPCAAFRA